jgi:hypothetical protein
MMRTVCLGWLRTHPSPIVLSDDGTDNKAVSIGMCADCMREWEDVAKVGDAQKNLMREAYVRYLKGQEPDPRD